MRLRVDHAADAVSLNLSDCPKRCRMVRIGNIAMAALRFVVALGTGLLFLVVLNAALLFADFDRLHGPIFAAGLVLTVAAAIRVAIRGRLTIFDRIAGTVAALALAAGRLFLPLFLAEGRDHFLFPDARGRVAAFTEVLLLGAIAHHAGMRYF